MQNFMQTQMKALLHKTSGAHERSSTGYLCRHLQNRVSSRYTLELVMHIGAAVLTHGGVQHRLDNIM